MISHRASRKHAKHHSARLESLEHRQLLSTAHAVPSYNVTGTFAPVTLPREIAGQPLTGAITIAVKNAGTLPLPGAQKITLRLIAHGTTKDVTLATSKDLSVAGLVAGASRSFSFDLSKATVPPVGDYTLEAQITPTPALTESSTADNLVTTTAANKTIPLHIGAPDLTGTLLPSTLPALLQAGNKNPVTGTLSIQIKNNGTAPLPAHEQITLQIRAHNVLTGKNFILNANPNQKFSVDALGINQTLTITPNLQFKGNTLPAGSYTLQALITPVQPLTESTTTNNLITTNAAGQPTTLVSQTALAPDLTGVFNSSTVQATANGTTGNLTITLTNTGTAAITGTHALSFAITARPNNPLNNPFLFDVATPVVTLPQHFSIKNLQVGQSATFTVGINDEPIALGSWVLTAAINVTDLPGPTAGNLITVNKSGALITLTSNNANATLGQPPIAIFNPIVLGPGPILLNPSNLTLLTQNPVSTPVLFAPITPAPVVIEPVSNITLPTNGATTYTGSFNINGATLFLNGGNPTLTNTGSDGSTSSTTGDLNIHGGVLTFADPNSGSATVLFNGGNGTLPVNGGISGTSGTYSLLYFNPPANATLPATLNLTNGSTLGNVSIQFTSTIPSLTLTNLSMEVALANGTVSLSNLAQNGFPLNLDFSNVATHVTHLTLASANHTAIIDADTTPGTGTLTLDGAIYTFSALSTTSNSLTFTLAPTTPA